MPQDYTVIPVTLGDLEQPFTLGKIRELAQSNPQLKEIRLVLTWRDSKPVGTDVPPPQPRNNFGNKPLT